MFVAAYPLGSVLFWIAVTLAPPDATQILIKGPEVTAVWARQADGWSYSANRSLWTIEGTTVVKTREGKSVKDEVGPFVPLVKNHDWKTAALLNLDKSTSLERKGETFVFGRSEGDKTKQYVIEYRRKPPAASGETPAAGGAKKPTVSWGNLAASLIPGRSHDVAVMKASQEVKMVLLASLTYALDRDQWPEKLVDLRPKYLEMSAEALGKLVYRRPDPEAVKKGSSELPVVLYQDTEKLGETAVVGFADGHVETVREPKRIEKLFPKDPAAKTPAEH